MFWRVGSSLDLQCGLSSQAHARSEAAVRLSLPVFGLAGSKARVNRAARCLPRAAARDP